jgi:pyrimidine operon attenuation protein / uracil phosphoribosyltransferase
MPNSTTLILPNPETLLANITKTIQAQLGPNTALVGIHSGGVWLMQRILAALAADIAQHRIPHGTLDAALYRDDYHQRGLKAASKPSNIMFDLQDKQIILIDDIFYTGRTTRAAMNELFDYGRPASITLAALINRGGAELPITPQIVGATLALKPNQRLQLTQNLQGKLELNMADNTNV